MTERGTGGREGSPTGGGGDRSPRTAEGGTKPSDTKSLDVIERELRSAGVTGTPLTASGQAAMGSPRGEETAGEGGTGAAEIGEDTHNKPGRPQGAQLEPAVMLPTGSVEYGSVPSPSGPVPGHTIADDKLRQQALDAANRGTIDSRRARRNSRFRLPDERVESMSPAELRAVAHDRGYDVGEGGRRAIQRAFIKAQKDDDGLEEPDEDAFSSETAPLPGFAGPGVGAAGPIPAVGGSTPPISTQGASPNTAAANQEGASEIGSRSTAREGSRE